MLETIILELVKRVRQAQTLGTKKLNIIAKTDKDGIYIETESSRLKFETGKNKEPYDLISKDFLLEGWQEFISARNAIADSFRKTRGRTSFLMALFSQLPFVKVTTIKGKTSIQLMEYLTDELPNEQYHKVKSFLEEMINGEYDPKQLSQQTDGNLYRVKSRARQDAKLLGFVNEFSEVNQFQLDEYARAENKDEYIKNILPKIGYFHMALICLDLLQELSKEDKRMALVELGMLIVRNSKGSNLMVESVAKERTYNLLKWLESTRLIDENWSPKEHYFETSIHKEQFMTSNIKNSLLRIMNEYIDAKRESFGGHPLGAFVRRDIPTEFMQLPFIDSTDYVVTGSVGQGNWASVPWIAIMHRSITMSTQRGYYIVYLFSEDMQHVYLTLAQGVTETSNEDMLRIKQEIRESIRLSRKVQKDDNIDLGPSKKARDYAYSTAAYIRYDLNSMPEEHVFVSDLNEMVEIYQNFITIKNGKTSMVYETSNPKERVLEKMPDNFSYKDLTTHIYNYITSKGFYYNKGEVTNLFLSLKSKPFVILSGISGTGKTKMVQWFAESLGANENNGQFTLIPIRPDWNDGSDLLGYRDIKGEFTEGPLTKVIKRASENLEKPYFVLLDEMNLARVEYYFSDILSVMESRRREDGKIVSSLLLSQETAGFELRIPNNLYFIGTVNMDETTHPFSKKVLDRANTIEFNRVELQNLDFLEEAASITPIAMENHQLESKFLHLKDVYLTHKEIIGRTTEELVRINNSLQSVHAHVGYRVRDEICFYLANNETGELFSFEEALDNCILQKILPRISGSDSRVEKMLKELYTIFTNMEYLEDSIELQHAKYPRSAEKVAEMLRRLQEDGFTSFWIS
ncbi:MrcB family domain-containing protein [Robertmurraya kyonggiensis]|uniref:DUF3578 domain-containing protein n=1 Tax=Robertmurraya kyonggiensis TaxID=1037680 RepID=A0A4U1DCB3_9BACI|nr:DUF3578 domain-containing protein [Robertmurraya kyonggiensis]TKC19126.1 DUF3578 domain-containing protein [Robertmurraya kyonggiensis]